MSSFEIKTNLPDWTQSAFEFVRKQAPFAISVALNDVAGKAREALQADLPKRFVLRGNWTEKGVQTNRATKKNLVAEVGHRQPYMVEQVTGGTRDTRGKSEAVPSGGPGDTVGGKGLPRSSPKSRTTKSKFPGALVAKGKGKRKPFIMTASNGKQIIARRKTKKRLGVQTLYKFPSSIKIDKAWPFQRVTEISVEKNWARSCTAAMEKAIASSKWDGRKEKSYRLKKIFG